MSHDKAIGESPENARRQLAASSLVALCAECDTPTRRAAVLALAQGASGAVPSCAKKSAGQVSLALNDTQTEVRRAAAMILAWFGEHAAEHRDRIASVLTREEDVAVCCWALRALARMGVMAADQEDSVALALYDTEADAVVRCLAVGVLTQFGDHAASIAMTHVGIIFDASFLNDVEVRRAAVFGFSQVGVGALPYLERICSLLHDVDVEVRRLAASTLERLCEAKQCSVSTIASRADVGPALAAALQDKDAEVRRWAARALEYLASEVGDCEGLSLRPFGAEIARAILDPDPYVCKWVLLAVAKHGQACAEHLQAITSLLGASNIAIRCLAVGALSRLGRQPAWLASQHLPGLMGTLASKNLEERRAASLALAWMEESDYKVPCAQGLADEGIFQAMRDPDPTVRRGGARALEQLEVFTELHAARAVETLTDPSSDEFVRVWVVRAMGHMGTRGGGHVEALIELLRPGSPQEDRNPAVRQAAVVALRHLGLSARVPVGSSVLAGDHAHPKFTHCRKDCGSGPRPFGIQCNITLGWYNRCEECLSGVRGLVSRSSVPGCMSDLHEVFRRRVTHSGDSGTVSNPRAS